MRKSRYVVETEGPQGQTLLFNTANGAFVELDAEGEALWGGVAEADGTADFKAGSAAEAAAAPAAEAAPAAPASVDKAVPAAEAAPTNSSPAPAAAAPASPAAASPAVSAAVAVIAPDDNVVADVATAAAPTVAAAPFAAPAPLAAATAPAASTAIRDAFETLQLLGFVTDLTSEQELQAQRDAFDRQRADTTSMTLSFIPTYVCNFRCPYCYELGHNKIPGKMDERMMDVIVEFVRARHEADGFTSLNVQWYGGDPSLALDEVRRLTEKLTSFCDARGIAYDAMILTNANVIDEEKAQLIADCRISSAFLTIDGPEEIHNKRRVAANGTNSYERTIQAARLLRERGLKLRANMNADKVTLPLYADFREKLLAEEGIELTFGKLNDYGHFFGEAPFCKPDFDLYDHQEFFRAQFQEFAKLPHTADEMREMLRPPRRFCTGQANNYFVIDLLGDVYKCDGWVGDREHAIFNLLDDPSTWRLDEVSFDPTRDARCSACSLMPLCLGSCIWERELSGMPCHPFKTTIGDYLRIYYECLRAPSEVDSRGVAAQAKEPITVLAV